MVNRDKLEERSFISTEDFLKLFATAKHLHVQLLNVECCVKISDLAIFKAKVYLGRLRSINSSFNEQLTVLSVARLCCYSSVRGIRESLMGLKLEERDLLLVGCFVALFFDNWNKEPVIGRVLSVGEHNFHMHYWRGSYNGKWSPQNIPRRKTERWLKDLPKSCIVCCGFDLTGIKSVCHPPKRF